MNFCKYFGLNVTSHKDLEFVDIDLSNDLELFIDPGLLYSYQNKDRLSQMAVGVIDNYFDSFFNAYKNNAPYEEKYNLFAHCHEPHYTKLGYGNGNNGKAKTPEGLIDVFRPLETAFAKGISLNHAIDLPLYMDGFAEDCLSDMLTNILFELLNAFTLEQCRILGIAETNIKMQSKDCYYWDSRQKEWDISNSPHLIVAGKIILLVPKKWVRHKFYYNSDQFIRSMILTRLQQEKTTFFDGKIQKPLKKDLREDVKKQYGNTVNIVHAFIDKWPEILNTYHGDMRSAYAGKSLGDDQLDEIVYAG